MENPSPDTSRSAQLKDFFLRHKGSLLIFGLLFALLFVSHGFYPFLFADDAVAYEQMQDVYGMNAFAYASEEYANWSSRYLYNVIGRYLVFAPGLYLFLDLGADLLTVYLLYLLIGEKKPYFLALAASLFLLIPLEFYWEAGWIMTSVNYSWAICASLAVLYVLKRVKAGEPIAWPLYLGAFLAAFYVLWSELLAALFFVLSLSLLVYFWLRKKRLDWFSLALGLMSLGGLLNAFLCPGNALRIAAEADHYFPGFGSLTFGGKIVEGYAFLAQNLFAYPALNTRLYFNNTMLFDLTLLFLLALAFAAHKKWYVIVLSALVFIGIVTLQILVSATPETFPLAFLYDLSSALPYDNPLLWVFLSVALVLLLGLFAEILLIYGPRSRTTSLLWVLLLMGMGLKLALGFSPTVYASRYRTDFPLYTVFILVSLLVLRSLTEQKKQLRIPLLAFLVVVALVVYGFSFQNWLAVYNPTDSFTFRLFS
jgi:hypothetical protein